MALSLLPTMAFGATTVASGYCGGEGDGTNLTWTLDSAGKLIISGTGTMAGYQWAINVVPWYSYGSSITAVAIGNGVTSIGSSAFEGCSSLKSMTIPNSVTSIGGYAFYNINKTVNKEITFSENLTSVESGAFLNTYITRVVLPGANTELTGTSFRKTGTTIVCREGTDTWTSAEENGYTMEVLED